MRGISIIVGVILLVGADMAVRAETYYVNDAFTNGDVYCTTAGADADGRGTNAATPMLSLTNLLSTYTLHPGDKVLIDTGIYTNYSVRLPQSASGRNGTNVVFQGSTNMATGGTIFDRGNASQDLFDLTAGVSNVSFRSLTAKNARYGFWLKGGNVDFSNVQVVGNSAGFYGYQATNIYFRNCVAIGNSFALYVPYNGPGYWYWENGVMWSNGTAVRVTYPEYVVSISNSAIVGGTLYQATGDAGTVPPPPKGDNNVLWQVSLGGVYLSMAALGQAISGQWNFSTYADPLFANGAAGDFHPQSTTGTYSNGGYNAYAKHSPLIDFGNPSAGIGNEPTPNGGVLDAGPYGGTAEASLSRTNAWLLATSFNDGGELIASGKLVWNFGSFTNGSTVRLDYSTDNGSTWFPLTNGIPVTNRVFIWNASSITSSPVARWRISGESPAFTNVTDTNDQYFVLRGLGGNTFYVNDASTNGDVYCSASGGITNSGLSPSQPVSTLQQILDKYDLGPGDTVYTDTGLYTGQTVTVTIFDQGGGTNYLTLQGSTNYGAGGTILDRRDSGQDILYFQGGGYVYARDIVLRGGRYGVNLVGGSPCLFEHVIAVSNSIGFYGYGSNHVFRRCAALGNSLRGISLAPPGPGNWMWDQGVFWGNNVGVFRSYNEYGLTISNSVIAGGTFYAAIGDAGVVDPPRGDNSIFWNVYFPTYGTLSEIQKHLNSWWRSTYADPFLANPAGLDFHEQSVIGTFSNGIFVTHTNHSPLIDFAPISAPYTNELAPNGARMNAGYYGNTSEASLSRTNAWLFALTYRDGGVLNPLSDVVYWNYGNLPSGATARIEFSGDNGASWEVAATGLLATAGAYLWANTNFTSSRFARWRIALESDTNVVDAIPGNFLVFRNGAYIYYLNDGNTNGDIYTEAIGSDLNLGTTPNSPKLSLQSLLNAHTLQPGDMVLIDTGYYDLGLNNTLTTLDSGGTNAFVYLQGSTNYSSGGSVFDRHSSLPTDYALDLNGASYVSVHDLVLRNSGVGLHIASSGSCRFQRVRIEDNATDGIQVVSSSGLDFDQTILRRNAAGGFHLFSGSVNMWRSILYRNSFAAARVDSGTVAISNSCINASGPTAYGYYAASTNNFLGSYNDFYTESNAVVGFVASLGRNMDTLGAWITTIGQERESLEADPLFADAASGDFHLRTQTPFGRPLSNGSGVTNDTVTSPLIDAGSPLSVFSNEPASSCTRIDVGYFGNTAEASNGRTNAWLFVSNFRNGGFMTGTGTFHWIAGGPATGGTVTVELSVDGGWNWMPLSTNASAAAENLAINSVSLNNSPAAIWRVRHNSFTNVADAATNFFSIRNGALKIYVNDATTNGDVYTSSSGSTTNYVASLAKPLDSLTSVFRLFDLEPGDTVFMDSGVYTNCGNVSIGRYDGGTTNAAISVVGSTNSSSTATILNRGASGTGQYNLQISNASGLAFSNLILKSANEGVMVESSSGIQFGRIRSIDNSGSGFDFQNSSSILLGRVVAARNLQYGITAIATPSVIIEQSIIWSNAAGAVQLIGGGATVTNSVLEVSGASVPLYSASAGATLSGDYNDILLDNSSIIGNFGPAGFQSLETWRQVLGFETHSLMHDPLFADGGADDFHLRSEAGRMTQSGSFTNDGVTSLLIDAGAMPYPFANETQPNGGRVNIGLYGNDPEESRSRTNGWLVAITMNKGGSMRGTNTLNWVAGGASTGHIVSLQYSADGGATWTNIVSGIAASQGSYVWNSTVFGSSGNSLWRIVDTNDPSISDVTDSSFTLNNGPLTYYVNDTSTNGDVYTMAPGNPSNNGATPGTPKDSIQAIIDGVQLQPGDTILADTGVYSLPSSLILGQFSAGTTTNPITIRGSTNLAAGGTLLNRLGGEYAVIIAKNANIRLQYLQITNASPALLFSQTTNSCAEFVSIYGGSYGVELQSAPLSAFRHLLVKNCGRGVYQRSALNASIENSVFWSNTFSIALDAGTVQVSNSVLAALSDGHAVYRIHSTASVFADYNDIFLKNGGIAATRLLSPRTVNLQNVSRWVRDYGQDVHSLSHDPLFANPDVNDFHVMSRATRFTNAGTTTNDAVTSPLIDAGSPNCVFTNEPQPNGQRINIGLYGNTAQASTSPSNAALLTLSLNDGGRAEGMKTIYWNATGVATGQNIKIEYSANSGMSWSVITSGIAAASGSYVWNTTFQTSSLFARWRVTSLTDTNATRETESTFALRNAAFNFYVNDAITNGDIYTTATGSVSNNGVSAASPVSSFQQILDSYDLEGGDTIFIDTGIYMPTGTVMLAEYDAGDALSDVIIRGSTNYVAGGTVLATNGLFLKNCGDVAVRDVTVQDAFFAVRIADSDRCLFERVTVANGNTGFEVNGANTTTFSNCIARNQSQQGVYLRNNASGANWQFGVLWSNTYGVRAESGSVSVRNSVIGALGPRTAAYYINVGALSSDYNDLYLINGAYAGYKMMSPLPIIYQNVSRWIRDYGQDAHSVSQDPLFADASSSDFHLKSSAGRFVSGLGYTNDAQTSALLDAADPSASFAMEPAPNGMRADIGRFGNDKEASLSATNSRLTVISLNDGGRAEGVMSLNWIATGNVTGQSVRAQFSADGGRTWTTIVSGISASLGTYAWTTTNFSSTALGLWRIASLIETNVADQTDYVFALRNQPLSFYVNDSSTTGDVYCAAIGSSANEGVLPSVPKASIQDVIDTYDLEPGDRVFIDTGTYLLSGDIEIGQFDQGQTGSRVAFIGSTNQSAGGTLYDRQGGAYAIRAEQAPNVELSEFNIQNASGGVKFNQSDNGFAYDVNIRGGIAGFEIANSANVLMQNCGVRLASYGVFVAGSQNADFESGVLWSNIYGVFLSSGSIVVSNSVFGAFGANHYAYFLGAGTTMASLRADYNDLYRVDPAYIAYFQSAPPIIHQNLSRWVRDVGLDTHSLSHDPMFGFLSPDDFHPMSSAGRFVSGGGYTNDASTSPLFDAGAPSSPFSREPVPNGNRINIGRFGNHSEAGLSPAAPSLTLVSLNDGGRVEGTNLVYWISRGSATGDTLRLEFSPDNGASWLVIASNVAVGITSNLWNSTLQQNTIIGKLRLSDEANTNVYDESDMPFAVRNGPIGFYVNDSALAGDVYCTAAGTATNLGVSPATPKASVQDILDTYDLEPGDTIYVDTGNYTLSAPITIGQFDAGVATNRVTIQGSTNGAAGGTVINRFGGDRCIVVDSAPGIAIRNLTLRNAGVAALRMYTADSSLVEWVRAESCAIGFEIDTSANATMKHCIARGNTSCGLWTHASSVQWVNGVMWSNVFGLVVDSGSASVANTAFGAFQQASAVYFIRSGTLSSDYNDLYITNGANIALVLGGMTGGGTSRYANVGSWASTTGRDTHSLSHEPRFANAAGGDFHLRSQGGRYVSGAGFVLDADTSALIDAGDPAVSPSTETVPNGGRINIGYDGDSAEASKTATNSSLTAISYNDGGSAAGNVSLVWNARGNIAVQTLRLEYSIDGGNSFLTIASGVSAASGAYVWNSTSLGARPALLWRITGQIETNISDTTDSPFYLRNGGGITYYVNDAATNGDVFTTAIGSSTNLGYLASSPKLSIQDILDRFDLDAGDRVLVDTGVYKLSADIVVGDLDAGVVTNYVTIEGSTNSVAGGTVVNRQLATTNTCAILLYQTSGIQLKNLRVSGAGCGVKVVQSASCRLFGVNAESDSVAAFNASGSTMFDMFNCAAVNCGAGIRASQSSSMQVVNGVVWNCGTAVELSQSSANIRNSVLQSSGNGSRVYKVLQGSSISGDYNDLIRTNGGYLVEQATGTGGNDVYQTLTDWVQASAQETHSLSHTPMFGNATGGDFHPLAIAGRYVPGTGYVTDTVQSVLIDTGNPSDSFANETAPNGGRIDMGIYGNRAESSHSRTNAWILAVTFNDGGVVQGTNRLYWTYGNLPTNSTVRLDYSLNAGADWHPIASNAAISSGSFPWDVSMQLATFGGLWRVTSEGSTSITDTVDDQFIIRTSSLVYFVNDAFTNGDVYTMAAGNVTNSGTSANSPMPSVQQLMSTYPLQPGDTVYVDTGLYVMPDSVMLNETVRGETGLPVRIIGSTNYAAGGSVLTVVGAGTGIVVQISRTRFITLENLALRGAGYGLRVNSADYCNFNWLDIYSNALSGVALSNANAATFTHCVSRQNGGSGLDVTGESKAGWQQCVIWSNRGDAVRLTGASLKVEDSILHAAGQSNSVYTLGNAASLDADYNILTREDGAGLARNTNAPQTYANMVEFQNAVGQEVHTLIANPLFAAPGSGDFHELSTGGRFSNGVVVADGKTSLAIDAGNPAMAYTNEPSPNGNRVNIGRYGNTPEASRSPTVPQLAPISLVDGGTLRGTIALLWLAQGFAPTGTVRLEFSADAGSSWTNIATGIVANIGTYTWDPSGYPSSPASRWRVISESDTNVIGSLATNFFLRVGNVNFYVNDSSTNGDLYCSAVGSPANLGLSAAAPMSGLQQVLDAYDVDGGDTIYVDTGVYTSSQDTVIGSSDSGMSTALVHIVGSTNWPARGTVLDRTDIGGANSVALAIRGARYLDIENICLQHAGTGLHIVQSSGIYLSNLLIRDGGACGILFDNANGNQVNHSVVTRISGPGISSVRSSANLLEGVIVWSNASHAIVVDSGDMSVSNSIINAIGVGQSCYAVITNASFYCDYNDVYPTDGATYGPNATGLRLEGLPQWTQARNSDMHSVSADPLFANPANDDYHLFSITGRFDPTTSAYIINDTNHSVLIDAACPSAAYTNEVMPNGERMDIGLYGNSSESSKSRTNAWLFALTASSGGRMAGSVFLDWNWGAMSPTNTVRLDYSYDNGVSWTNIATAIQVGSMDYPWDSAQQISNVDVYVSSPIARWRVVLEADTNVFDQTDNYFALRNSPFNYYVNDSSVVGDVFTTHAGSDTNLGLFAYAPKATMQSLLDVIDVEGPDIIWVDTGVYNLTNTFGTLSAVDSGSAGLSVELRGSTNGTVLRRVSGASTIMSITGPHVRLSDFSFIGGQLSLASDDLDATRLTITNGVLSVIGNEISALNVQLYNSSIMAGPGAGNSLGSIVVRNGGVFITNASSMTLNNLLVSGVASTGISVLGNSSGVTIENCTVAVSGNQLELGDSASVVFKNNIVVANGPGRFCLRPGGGLLISDFNNLVARNGAWIGAKNGYWERLSYWQRESGQDLHSLSHEPLFANESSGDYHLSSVSGRYSNGVFVVDAVHSPSIDAGDPARSVGSEIGPNGERINQGAYGGTGEASLSRTNGWLLAMSMNDGGVFKGTNVLVWSFGGLSPTSTVTLQYSWDAGSNWTMIAANVIASNGAYLWDSTSVTSTLAARWRVVLDEDSNVSDAVDNVFAVRNAPLSFFVNDVLSSNDVFCTVAGAPGNSGLLPSSPKDTINGLLGAYDTEGGDVLYIDAGTYSLTSDVTIIWSRGGDLNSGPLRIRGSTNYVAGGTRFVRGNITDGIGFDVHASFVDLRDIAVRNAFYGVRVDGSRYVRIDRVLAYSNEVGIAVTQGLNTVVVNSRLWNNRQGGVDVMGSKTTVVENCTFVGNVPFGFRGQGSSNTVVDNGIFDVDRTNATALAGSVDDALIDYNVYFLETNSLIHPIATNLMSWQIGTGHDFRSAVTNPLFANKDAGDFHEKSEAGRYVDGGGFTSDVQTSWAIDHGNPASAFTNEPSPSGGRVNIGAYGNTEFASKGTTNVILEARSLNDAVTIDETQSLWPLRWSARNVPTDEVMRVQFSGDAGASWFDLQTGLSPYREYYLWQTVPFFNTYRGLWRVIGQGDTNLCATSTNPFEVKYGEFAVTAQGVSTGAMSRIRFRGAWGENYRVQFSTNLVSPDAWFDAPSGPAPDQMGSFYSTNGGDFFYEDIGSITNRLRTYRVIRDQF